MKVLGNTGAKKARVLIVDDTPVTRESLKIMLKKMGHEVVGIANDGVEALEMYKQLKPDIVTMDMMMPRMEGPEATKRIIDYDPNAVVLIVSAMDDSVSAKKGLDAGAVAYIVNPFTFKALKNKMDILVCHI